jgi:hypothetical protein
MFGIDNGVRIGFGYDVEGLMKGLALLGDSLGAAAPG